MAVRIYFTSDIHGSDKCWLKFVRSAEFYEADVIIVGGDITGKFLVPIVTEPDGRVTATFHGRGYTIRSAEDLADLKRRIAFAGSYALEVTREEHDAYAQDPERLGEVFDRLVLERVERWMALADERLAGTSVECYVSGGNDDDFVVDEVIQAAERVQCPEARVVRVGGELEMAGLGYANRTPWNCPRDIDEDTFAERIAAVAEHLERPETAIFDFHAPPYESGLDVAPRLTADLQIVSTSSGEPEYTPVGSRAVRDAIDRYQPLLGLHGHVHESPGVKRLGRTTVVNPGSEYQEGILNGVLIDLDRRSGVKRAQLVSG
jgi:Icc-related predicted phosphoesterase